MSETAPLCGLWVDIDFTVYLSEQTGENQRSVRSERFSPFLWSMHAPDGADAVEELEGNDPFRYRAFYNDPESYKGATGDRSLPSEAIRPLETQYLLQQQKRFFTDMRFGELRRLQLDIETSCSVEGGFPSPTRKGDRVLAIGLQASHLQEPIYLELEEETDAAERALLKRFGEVLRDLDPDTIEGHNIFSFDLDYLYRRCRRFKLEPDWGRFDGVPLTQRKTRLRIAERWLDYIRFDIPGRTVFDTYLALQIFDISRRDLPGYGLKDAAVYFGITEPEKDQRTYIEGSKIQHAFREDRERFLAYLGDDLRETKGLADILLPTYFAQCQNFPMPLQEVVLRGTAQKIDTVFLEKYYHANRSLPEYPVVDRFEGAFSKSFETGVFHHVLHYDVASLYPSLLLSIGRNPGNDSLGIFNPMLKELREYRLKYKQLAREAETDALKQEYDARQQSFKILINSFYGYLGFGQARFADSGLAAEVTRRGRELLQELIDAFQKENCTVLEADTDGIYLCGDGWWEQPEALLEKVLHVLPEGIALEYDGSYESMFCYKAKNYALYDGKHVLLRGSALRSRGVEPFLSELSDTLIKHQLGAIETEPSALLEEFRKKIENNKMPVEQLAKSEYLSMAPASYKKKMDAGGKPRRAALEVALKMDREPKMGEKVRYYIKPKEKGQTSDWQRALPLEAYDATTAPYDPQYYLKKLKDWAVRYEEFLPQKEVQQELL
ncbi:MAG: DNA polymerase [Opitutales bacterium]|nr:DNA polymerase [Opitutales bacterium]